MSQEILDRRAAAVIEANKYMTLGTVDADGLPWVTPVYFTPTATPTSTGSRPRIPCTP